MTAENCPICARVGPPLAQCAVCERRKQPIGRSAPDPAGYCTSDCPGYLQDPRPDELWPGECYGESLGHMDWHDEVTDHDPEDDRRHPGANYLSLGESEKEEIDG